MTHSLLLCPLALILLGMPAYANDSIKPALTAVRDEAAQVENENDDDIETYVDDESYEEEEEESLLDDGDEKQGTPASISHTRPRGE